MKSYLFKIYVLGYLNEYHLNSFHLNNKNNINYKKFKTIKVAHYLKIPVNFLKVFISFIAFFEIPITILVLCFLFTKYSLLYLATKSINITNKKLMFGYHVDEFDFHNMMNSTDLNLPEITIVKLPSINFEYSDYKSISIFSGLDFRDILKSYFYSIELIFYMNNKYGEKDFFFRSYSSFEYFLCYFFTKKSNLSNIYYFDALVDRFAYLHGGLKHETIFIQHGNVSDKMRHKKIGTVSYAYYLNKKQKENCEKILFNNKPGFSFMKQSVFNPTSNKLLKNKLKNILLICNMLFFEKEKEIIEDLSKKNINLYVKPHPHSLFDPYEKLNISNNFVILQREDFPKVDIVISYSSTLATAYENYGIKVLNYDDELFKYKYEKI